MSLPPVSATFRAPFRAQVAALRLRLGNRLPSAVWTDLDRAQHERAFVVAGATKADLLADLAEAVRRAVEEGRTLEWFRTEFRRIVEERGWHGWTGEGTKKGEAWRTRVIFRTNMATSYAAGRMAQLQDLGYRFWIYRHGGSVEPRLQHLGWDGLILPPDHPFWDTHAPPNGWGCSCRIRGADSMAGAIRKGGKPGLELPSGWDRPDPRTGVPPGIDKGWDYPVGRSVAREVAEIVRRKAESLPPGLGAAVVAEATPSVDGAWRAWVAGLSEPGRNAPALAGALSDDVQRALDARGIAPASAGIIAPDKLFVGSKARRHEAAGDGIGPDALARLPALLRVPRAVLLDKGSGNLLYIVDAVEDGRVVQVAVTVNYRLKADRKVSAANVIVSVYRPRMADLAGRLAGGLVELLSGSLG